MSKSKILFQIDAGTQTSAFDSVVAIDSGVDHLLRYNEVTPDQVQELVHGAIFTRGNEDLKSTALFFGGSDVDATEALVAKAKDSFFGPMRVSYMSDPNGCNTTAAAAVICASKHFELNGKTIAILGGTGPVGRRIAALIAGSATAGNTATIRIGSRTLKNAQSTCDKLLQRYPDANLLPCEVSRSDQIDSIVGDADAVFSAGAAGVELMDERWKSFSKLMVAIDLNAVPPLGIRGIAVSDAAKDLDGMTCYGAIGVGELKMKIHKRAIQMLFQSSNLALEVEEIFAIGREI